MKLKLRLDLTGSEVVALNSYVASWLTRYSFREVQDDLPFYMALASLYEIYAKTGKLTENIRLFPTRRTDETYRVTFTRTQCLALAVVGQEDEPNETGLQTYEGAFLQRLFSQIHQTFLI